MILSCVILTSFFILIATPPAFALMNDEQPIDFAWQKETLDVTLMSSAHLSDRVVEEITQAVTSTEFYNIEDNLLHKMPKGYFSDYYLGWQGALDNTNSTNMKLNFNIDSYGGGGDIVITPTTRSHPEGFAGIARPLMDNGQIVKVYIIIYEVDKRTPNSIYSIVMHELGHALGLGHSTAPEEVMHKKITTAYPYVTPCMMLALDQAYQEKEPGVVTCLK